MSIFIKKDGKKVLPLSFYIKIFSFFALIGLSAVAMMPFQNAISQAMYTVRNDFINSLEILTKMDIQYSSIRPTIFGTIDIRNLKFLNGDHPVFSVSRIRINFSLAELIFQRRIFIHTVQIERPVFNIDTERDSEPLEFFSSLSGNGEAVQTSHEKVSLEQISKFLPRNANYRIRHGSFYLVNEDSLYSIDDVNLNIRTEEKEVFLEGNIIAEYRYSGFSDRTIILSTGIGINGLTSENLQGSADISFSYITVSEQNAVNKNPSFFRPPVNSARARTVFTIHPFNITAHHRNNELYAIRPKSDNSFAYNVRYNTKREFFFLDLDFSGFKLADIIDFSDYLNNISHLLDISMNGTASFSLDQITDSFVYKADLKGGDIDALQPFMDTFYVNIEGDQEKISITDFLLSASDETLNAGFFRGSAGLSGEIVFSPLAPSATLFFDNFSFGGNESISAVFESAVNMDEFIITSGEIKIAQTVIYDLNAFLYPTQTDIDIKASCFGTNGGEIFFDAVLNNDPGHFEATLSLESFSVFDITEILRPFSDFIGIPFFSRSYLQGSLVSADFFFSTDFNNIVYNAPNINFNLGDDSFGNISLSGTDRQFTLSEGIITVNENDFNVSANMVFSNPMELIFSLNASFLDLAWQIEGQILDRTTLIIHDPNGLSVYGNVSNTGALSGYAECVKFPVPLGEHALYLDFYSALRYDSPDFWNLDFNYFSAVYEGEEVFKTHGMADQNGAKISDIFYTDSQGILLGEADFSWNIGFSDIGISFNANDGSEDGENYFLEGEFKNNKINVNASVFDMHINRFTGTEDLILLSAQASASWDSIDLFTAQVDLKSFEAYLEGAPVSASVALFLSDEELLMQDLNLNYSGVKAHVPQLLFNRSEGIAKTRMEVEGSVINKKLEGIIDLGANFESIDSWLNIRDTLNKIDGRLSLENVTYGDFSHQEVVFEFSANEGALSVSGGIDNMLRLEKESSGYFFLGLSSPFPINGAVTGTYESGNITAYCNNFFIDMELLYALTAVSTDFNITGGYITGNMEFIGPFWDPLFYGTGLATGMLFQSSDFVKEVIRAVPFSVVAEGREMTFENVTIAAGSGSGIADGWFHFLNWSPVSIGLDISIPRETPIPYGLDISGFTAEGNAAGNINMMLDTANRVMELKGDLFTNTAELGLNLDSMSDSAETEPQMQSVIELTVTTGSMVEFTWPSTSPIIRANPEMGTVVTISSDTQSGIFSLNGNVNIRSGEIYYFNRSFYIRQGNLALRENETQFNPLFSARAEIRERADSGAVTISMLVDNKPLLSFEPTFVASPSLTQLEIYTILGQNLGSIAEGDTDATRRFLLSSTTDVITQIVATSDVMSQFMFFRQMERQVRDTFRLDMFSIRTRFLHNAVISGWNGIEQQFRQRDDVIESDWGVGNYFDNTTVFVGKYVGRDMFLQGMLRLRYDENDHRFGGIVFEPDIGIELQSPLLNIRWDFFPYHPYFQTWWVNGNSITLSWSKSF